MRTEKQIRDKIKDLEKRQKMLCVYGGVLGFLMSIKEECQICTLKWVLSEKLKWVGAEKQ